MRKFVRFVGVVGVACATVAGCSFGQADPFDFDTDDLCDWVSAEDVAGLVGEAYGWEVAAVEVQPEYEEWDCQWELTGPDGEEDVVYAGEAVWEAFGGGPYDLTGAMTKGVVDFADIAEEYVPIGASVTGHPSLSEGVVVHNGGFGQFAFGVPPRDQYLHVSAIFPGDEDWEHYEPKFFAVANGIIEALGWLPAS
jgi:hypothetical protein